MSVENIKYLRDQTGAGIMDCQRALRECAGNLVQTIELLHQRGALRQRDRITAEGLIGAFVSEGRTGALVEINCETDFVARTAEFQTLVDTVARATVNEQIPISTIEQLRADVASRTGEQINLRRTIRWELGGDEE